MKPRSRTRRVLKWFTTCACVLLALAIAISCDRSTKWVSPTRRYAFALEFGAVSLTWPSAIWELTEGRYEGDTGWSVSTYGRDQTLHWWIEWYRPAYYESVRFPLWIPFVLCGIPSALLWYQDRREVRRTIVAWLRPRRRGGARRAIKLTLTAASVALVLVFSASLPWSFVARGQSQTLVVSSGQIGWFRVGERDARLIPGAGIAQMPTGVHMNESWRPAWEIELHWQEPWRRLASVELPIWLPLLLLGFPTALLWWAERWRGDERRCVGCGYDLTGNESGVCPECGTPATREERAT